ncbi:hypothetical protein [Dysgonomonas massiliensis]|uniref:hypothetical protein n=1 Tax=Dysgonomonas massiliensis TaxID=2040292 RepID=UPI000C7887B5|nr:hypothetical protein [Dysgonomonas massiliensis]
MKKIKLFSAIFLIAAMFLGFTACNSDDNNEFVDTTTGHEVYKREMIEKYNVKANGLDIKNVSENDAEIIFYGELANKFWIACYNKESKEQLMQWHDTELIKDEIDIDLGYGNTQTIRIDEYRIIDSRWSLFNDSFVFQLVRFSQSHNIYDIYFINNGRLAKTLSNTGDPFYSWYNGSILTATDNKNTPDRRRACYDAKGNKLFDITRNFPHETAIPINYYEYILFEKSTITRKNLETDKIIWSVKSPLDSIPSNAKQDSTTVSKENNLWTFIFNYTLYDGTKVERIYELNIETGEYKQL